MSVSGLGVVAEWDSFKAMLAGMRGLSDIVTYYPTWVSYFGEEKDAYIFRISWRSDHHLVIVRVMYAEIFIATGDSL